MTDARDVALSGPSILIVVEEPPNFSEHGEIPIAFRSTGRVRSFADGIIDVINHEPYVKDYDSCEEDRPANLSSRFDVSEWGLIAAFDGTDRVGGAVLAWNTPGVDMLQGRTDLAVVWDLRVAASHRRTGIGGQLWTAALEWSRKKGCTELRVETQDINPAACRFYAAKGCVPIVTRPNAYPEAPGETQIVWGLRLPQATEEARETR
jgi:GNAT superfamily N-acetyltransferase